MDSRYILVQMVFLFGFQGYKYKALFGLIYECESWPRTLRKERRLRLFGN
jgi:hypothetical protein